MIVVSDASPLIALAAVGQVDLLHQLYATVLVPDAVHQEVTAQSPDAPGAAQVRGAEWIHSVMVRDRILVEALCIDLDRGEAEAIALAVERSAELLLMDERRGRAAAVRLGRRVVGVLGILIQAKHERHLPAVKPVLDALERDAGFRVSRELYARVLTEAGE